MKIVVSLPPIFKRQKRTYYIIIISMSKNLVIVESPAKAKTIEKFLGKDYLVKSSFGHVRDLPKKTLSIDIEHGYVPTYEITSDKKKVIKELSDLSAKAEMVWLASDEDREGEAISWHLVETLKLDESKTKRIVFHEITKPAIQKAVIAQLVERRLPKPQVAGSSPVYRSFLIIKPL